MEVFGNLRKMQTRFDEPIQYSLRLGEELINMTELVGKRIRISYTGEINCKRCGELTKKSFSQGFCYLCFRDAPENSPCIIRPEECEAHMGKGRDPEWEREHHLKPHTVYLAVTNGLKVGVTRMDQVPTRWIDQGAWKAVRLADVPYRQLAGAIEVSLKPYITDKTSWQRMLKDERAEDLDIMEEREAFIGFMPEIFHEYASDDEKVWELKYPVLEYPEKVKSVNLDKTAMLEGQLMGIRGQYLLLEEGKVMNIRRHAGYQVNFSVL